MLGLAVFFLARILGALYFINNIDDKDLVARSRRSLIGNSVLFLSVLPGVRYPYAACRGICGESGRDRRSLYGALI